MSDLSTQSGFIHFGGFILRTQRPQPVGNEVLDFQVVRGGRFQLTSLHQGLLLGEAAVLGGFTGFGVIEGFDGEGERGLCVIGLRLFAGHGRVRWVQGPRWP